MKYGAGDLDYMWQICVAGYWDCEQCGGYVCLVTGSMSDVADMWVCA